MGRDGYTAALLVLREVLPDSNVCHILNHVQSQQSAVVFGVYAQELIELCNFLGIKMVVD
jgi:hypothetical protein